MRRSFGVLVAMVLGVAASSAGPAGAQVDVTAFCQSRANLAAALGQGDEAAVKAEIDALAASAPVEVQEHAVELAALVAEQGSEAFGTDRGAIAADVVDDYVVDSCGYPVLEVSGIDYGFEGISGPLTAGPYVVELTNDAPKEHHELMLFRVKPGEDLPVKKLLGLPEKQAAKKVDQMGAAHAAPGDVDTFVTFLDPGRYVYACFLAVGTTSTHDHGGHDHGGHDHGAHDHGDAAKPHWAKGMRGELEVVGGA